MIVRNGFGEKVGVECTNPSCDCHERQCCEKCLGVNVNTLKSYCQNPSCDCHNTSPKQKKVSKCCGVPMRYIDDFLCCAGCGKETEPVDTSPKSEWEDGLHQILTDDDGKWAIEFKSEVIPIYSSYPSILEKHLKSFITQEKQKSYSDGYENGKSHYLQEKFFGDTKLDVIVHATKEFEHICKRFYSDGLRYAVEQLRLGEFREKAPNEIDNQYEARKRAVITKQSVNSKLKQIKYLKRILNKRIWNFQSK